MNDEVGVIFSDNWGKLTKISSSLIKSRSGNKYHLSLLFGLNMFDAMIVNEDAIPELLYTVRSNTVTIVTLPKGTSAPSPVTKKGSIQKPTVTSTQEQVCSGAQLVRIEIP